MTNDPGACFSLGLAAGALLCFAFLLLAASLAKKAPELPPYRKVIQRTPESVQLECGHVYTITRVERSSLPCQACGADAKEQSS